REPARRDRRARGARGAVAAGGRDARGRHRRGRRPPRRPAALMLSGKRLLVTGVATRQSIAFAVAAEAQRAGAEVVLTSFGRMRSLTERAAKHLPETADILELDVTRPEHFEALARSLEERWGGIDGVLHAIAFAPEDALGGNFLATPPE